jgi:hypothetical protein
VLENNVAFTTTPEEADMQLDHVVEKVVNDMMNHIMPDKQEVHKLLDEIEQEMITTPKVKNISDHVVTALTPAQQALANEEPDALEENLAKSQQNKNKRNTAEQLVASEALKKMSLSDKKNAILALINDREEVAVGFDSAINLQQSVPAELKKTFNRLIFDNTKQNIEKDQNTPEDIATRVV